MSSPGAPSASSRTLHYLSLYQSCNPSDDQAPRMSVNWTPDKDLPELTGKIFVVTGTSSGGVGREIIKHLALAGAKVYATARSETRSRATIEGILKEHSSIKEELLVPLMVDFESPESVQDAVTELKKKESKLDVMSKEIRHYL